MILTDLGSLEQSRVLEAAGIEDIAARRRATFDLILAARADHTAAAAQRDALAALLDRAKRDLAQFQEQVRDVAIRVQESRGWCVDGLNEVLEELDLPRKVMEWEVEVEVTARQTVTITVEAPDVHEARERIEQDIDLSEELDPRGWVWDSSDVAVMETREV